jgi:DAK2 domain fusion protein YloV
MIKTIDGAAFSRMMLSAAAEIDLNKQKVNELNVFPVPDGDTGTNMSMTLSAASTELRKADGITLTKAADKTASALLRGARGNSGVILSLLFRGFSKSLKGKLEADGKDFAAALTAGVEAAYKAVMKPAEGTILTVSRLTADAARDLAEENNEIEYVLQHCLDTAHAALDNTVNQNPVLKKAGVVDAGGMGFCLILRGMLESLRGNDIVCEDTGATNEEADFGIFDSEDITFAFDTVFIVRKREDITSLDPLREYLGSIGDSLVIGEDDEAFKVHVHTNIPGDALSEAQKYGTLELAKIENMRLQHDDLTAGRKARSTDDLETVEKELESQPAEQAAPAEPEKRYGSVAVCAGAGLAGVFRDLGVDEIIEGGQTMNPSTEDILHAIEKTPAEIVFVLPNNKNIIMAAEQAQKLADRQVVVLPTRTVPMGITALLNFDPSATVEANTINMMSAADKVSTGLITYAARDSEYDGKRIRKGEIMALENGKIVSTSSDITKATYRLARGMCKKDSSFVTIISGCDVSDEDAEKVTEIVKAKCPNHVEVSHIRGGQPVYYYMISVE